MSDVPFGFGPADRDREDDPDRDKQGGGGSGPGGQPLGFGFGGIPGMPPGFMMPGMPGGPAGPGGAGGFDMGQLGQMLSQLGQMLSNAGSSTGPVNYDLAKQIATQQLTGTSRPNAEQRKAVTEAFGLAELWLDPATTFPTGTREVAAWSPKEWVEASMQTWQRLCDPVAQRVSTAWVEGLPEEARQVAGPMMAMFGQMGGLAFGSQLGTGLGQLATEVLTSTDIGFPVGAEGTAALLPAAIEKFTTGLDRPASEVMVYLAAREAAHQRLFAGAPWLRGRLLAAVEEYARGITVDTSRIEQLAQQLDPSDPKGLEEAMRSGLFEPETTPEQQAALGRLETLLALVEGWVEVVVTAAVTDRLPGASALGETLRRRRASGGPAEQTFATLVGLELRPRRIRQAVELWQGLTAERGVDGRDEVWAHPDLIPTSADLDDPAGFAYRVQDDDTDPIAELERAARAESERAGSEQSERAGSERAEEPDGDGPPTDDPRHDG
jgi:putative hydrolase